MARILTRSNRPIVIQEAQSGMDMLLSEVSKYVSPEYQQQRKINERADARFELDKQNSIQNRNYRQQQMEMSKAQENDRKIQFRQQQKSIKDKKAMDEFSIMYPETLSSDGLDIAKEFLDNNLIGSSSYEVLDAKIKSDRNKLITSNKKIDSLGEFIYEDDYDPIKHRNLVDKQSNFLIQNKLKQDMFGELNQTDRITLKADIDFITSAIEFARESEILNPNSYNEAIIGTVIPTFKNMQKAYGDNFSMPALEGIIKGVDPNFGVDVEVPIGNEKIMEETEPSQTAPSQTVDYIQLANQGALEPKKIIESLADRGEGSLGILETAANEGSVVVPVNKEVRKAVKTARNDIGKASSIVAKSFGYGSNKLVSPEVRTQNIEQLKTALVNAVNLYKSIDPQQGRAKTLITPAGGKSERMVIKKSIDNLKTLIDRSKFKAGSLKNLPEDIKSFIRNIDLEGAQDNRMMAEDDGSFLEGLLPTVLQASQNNIPSPLDNFILESATE